MNFNRIQKVESSLTPHRALVIYGPRRIGKTTLVKRYMAEHKDRLNIRYESGDDLGIRDLFKGQSKEALIDFVKPYDCLIIDEAQMVSYIGIGIKMIIDELPDKTIILTGSSSFLLAQEIGAPLLGRHFEIKLLPLSWNEIAITDYDRKNNLENLLIYGSYPEVLLSDNSKEKEQVLKEIVSSFLFKDAFMLDKIKSHDTLVNITKCLAFQIGSEVSINEISRTVGADVKTVSKYVDALEKSFIIKKVTAFSRNPRNEISKKAKYYFYDLGIRNAIISRFQGLDNRDINDKGALFENYIFMELYKRELTKSAYFNEIYFWRNKKGKEVDIVIEKDGKVHAYECKFTERKVDFSDFLEMYPQAETILVHKENISEVLHRDA